MKRERDAVKDGSGRDLVVLKASVVDAELAKLDLNLRTVSVPGITRMVSPTAYEAGEAVGASSTINAGSWRALSFHQVIGPPISRAGSGREYQRQGFSSEPSPQF